MPFFDLDPDALETYRPDVPEPPDFDAFWSETLAEARAFPLDAMFVPVDVGLRTLKVFDVTYSGYGGQRIKGWLLLPLTGNRPQPGVVEYIGYGGGRGTPLNWLTWPSAGYPTLVMDTRGQGSAWLSGDTPDLPDGANPSFPGFMTQGVLDRHTYYYRRVYTDAVRAIEALRQHDSVDPARIALTGGSQGGGLTLAAAGLTPDIAAAMPDVPFLCHFRRSVGLSPENPYAEIASYLSTHRDQVDTVFDTLNYFDGIQFARRIQAPVLCSTGLMDTVCPPSTVYAAYHNLRGPKEIAVYPYNGHDGGGPLQTLRKIDWLQRTLPLNE